MRQISNNWKTNKKQISWKIIQCSHIGLYQIRAMRYKVVEVWHLFSLFHPRNGLKICIHHYFRKYKKGWRIWQNIHQEILKRIWQNEILISWFETWWSVQRGKVPFWYNPLQETPPPDSSMIIIINIIIMIMIIMIIIIIMIKIIITRKLIYRHCIPQEHCD